MPAPNAKAPSKSHWGQLGNTLTAIFVVAVLINYLWELAQAPLYVGLEDFWATLWHCFMASLGDGLLVLGIFAVGWAILRQQAWFVAPGGRGVLVMVGVGLMLSVTIEWVAVHILERWAYTAWMPRVPRLDIGLVPVVQMLVLPPLIFRVVARWRGGTAARC
jgi:hypothetical protein